VDVVGPGEVRGVGRAQEAEAVLEHLEGAVAEDRLALLRLVLEESEDELLLAQSIGALELVGVRHVDELGNVLQLEIGEVHAAGLPGCGVRERARKTSRAAETQREFGISLAEGGCRGSFSWRLFERTARRHSG